MGFHHNRTVAAAATTQNPLKQRKTVTIVCRHGTDREKVVLKKSKVFLDRSPVLSITLATYLTSPTCAAMGWVSRRLPSAVSEEEEGVAKKY